MALRRETCRYCFLCLPIRGPGHGPDGRTFNKTAFEILLELNKILGSRPRPVVAAFQVGDEGIELQLHPLSDGLLKLFNPAFATIWKLNVEALDAGPHIDEVTGWCRALLDEDTGWDEIKRAITSLRQ